MRTFFLMIIVLSSHGIFGQENLSIAVFEELSECKIDSVQEYDNWYQKTSYYPSGSKQDEVRVFISGSCKENHKCIVKYQHQVYYDDESSTIALKEGKYMVVKNGKASYHHYAWWYTKQSKLFRKIKEKTTKKL